MLKKWSWMVLWRPTRPFRTNTQKRCPFHYRGLECESRKSRNTWGNRQIWPWNTEWSRAKANRVLPREHTHAGKDWRQKEKGPTEDEMVGWYHWLNGHELSKPWELVMDREACCSMSSSNCCFLTCIQISQEAGQMVWYSISWRHGQFVMIHTVKSFGIVNKAEVDVFLELSCFFHDPADVGNLISGSSAFSKSSLNI